MSKLNSQANAVSFINRVLNTYKKSQANIRPHFIVSGESGTGKSYLLEVAARAKGFNFLNINAAQLTREGLSGNSLSKALVPLKKLQKKPVLILFDEFDKLFLTSTGTTTDERSGVQAEILHIISSKVASIVGEYGQQPQVSTSQVIFVFAGAFGGLDSLSPKRLQKIGMIPELLGRVNLHVHLESVDVNELVEAVPNEELFLRYIDIAGANELETEKHCTRIQDEIKKQYKDSVIGYRLVLRVIHQYFLYQGKFPSYDDEKDEIDADVELYRHDNDADNGELDIPEESETAVEEEFNITFDKE